MSYNDIQVSWKDGSCRFQFGFDTRQAGRICDTYGRRPACYTNIKLKPVSLGLP
jgi:hypothetical protein